MSADSSSCTSLTSLVKVSARWEKSLSQDIIALHLRQLISTILHCYSFSQVEPGILLKVEPTTPNGPRPELSPWPAVTQSLHFHHDQNIRATQWRHIQSLHNIASCIMVESTWLHSLRRHANNSCIRKSRKALGQYVSSFNSASCICGKFHGQGDETRGTVLQNFKHLSATSHGDNSPFGSIWAFSFLRSLLLRPPQFSFRFQGSAMLCAMRLDLLRRYISLYFCVIDHVFHHSSTSRASVYPKGYGFQCASRCFVFSALAIFVYTCHTLYFILREHPSRVARLST